MTPDNRPTCQWPDSDDDDDQPPGVLALCLGVITGALLLGLAWLTWMVALYLLAP